ncbi:hypothetical protein T06_2635 [Trichinella sp. T6]|nr:hypothetical protein T06_2635 [Trichinella sp. T6]
MKRADAVLNQVCSLAKNYHKAQTNVEVSCQAAYSLEQPHTIIMSTLRTFICDASGKKICITMPYYVDATTKISNPTYQLFMDGVEKRNKLTC